MGLLDLNNATSFWETYFIQYFTTFKTDNLMGDSPV